MTDVFAGPEGTAPSDGELILEVRGGSLDAYGALYERHASAARILARQYVRSHADADDVVADAFQRVLGVLRQGSGPDTHFRAYLFTVVRRLAADVSTSTHRTRPTDDDGTFELALGPSGSSEDPALAGFESSVVARAYERLPERWQAVLWYTEVERLSPADVAPILGLTPNGVSALAYRAREGLRVGYLQEHLTAEPADTCRIINPMLGGYVRGSLSRREISKVDGHLEGCDDCRTLVLELGDVAHGMRVVIAPLVLGVAGLAVLGSLPLGALTGAGLAGLASGGAGAGAASAGAVGAGSGATGGVGAAAGAGSAATGTAGAGAAGAGAGAAGAGAGAGAGAAGAGAVGATGSVAGGTAAATATAATAATASTATSVAATAVVATGTAGMSAVTVAASTGAVAAATVGVVSVLGAMGGGQPAPVSDPPPAAIAAPWPSAEDETPQVDAQPAPEPSADPTDPANVPALVDPETVDQVVAPAPADLAVVALDPADVLVPRVTDQVALQVGNSGGTAATDAQLRVRLPDGMAIGAVSSPVGASAGPQVPIDATSLPCTATAEPQVVQCRLGTIEPGGTSTVSVPVLARSGGSYDLDVSLWVAGVETRRTTLPATQVAYFGPQLTADTGQVVAVDNPGRADVTFTVANTGDLPAAAGWRTKVRVPVGLVPHAVSGALTCEPAGEPTEGYRVWRCTGPELAAGTSLAGVATVLADGSTAAGDYSLQVVPELPGDGPSQPDAAPLSVARAWVGAIAGAGGLQASCRATGGIGVADAVVTGTYTNRTGRTLTVGLDAAGSSSETTRTVAPGESADLVVPDGLRVPAKESGTWRISTTVAGNVYSRTVDSTPFGSAECYDPAWDVEPSATVVNDGGQVTVSGTLANRGDDPMQVTMRAAGAASASTQLGAGETVTLSVPTGRRSLEAGSVTFDLVRWRTDRDGDQPTNGVSPRNPRTASYQSATIEPAAGAAQTAGECTYDPAAERSSRTFAVPLDNSASTLPVDFEVRVGDRTERVRLGAGESKPLQVTVPWGAQSGRVLADGREIGTLDVSFASCATPLEWPDDVTVTAAAQCEAGVADVVVDVANGGGRAWRASVERGGEHAASGDVASSGSRRFVIDTGRWAVRGEQVTVRLARTVEGAEQVVSRVAGHDGVRCPVVAPTARLEDGETRLDRYGDWTTSWREPAVVLDNAGSNVAVTFTVVGEHGLHRTVRVPAGQTDTVQAPRVDGRRGASYTVSTKRWSTTLETGTFTGAEAGWCAERIAWGVRYAPGDIGSWNGFAYRYAGWDGTAPEGAEADGPGSEWWKDGHRWNGQWGQWERIGNCEYR